MSTEADSTLPAALPAEMRPAPLWRAAVLATVVYGLLMLGSIALSRQPGSVATLWYAGPAGAVLLAPRRLREWPLMLLMMLGAQVGINLSLGDPLRVALTFLPADLLEIGLGLCALALGGMGLALWRQRGQHVD